jgi:subtilisin family serine protease
MNRFLVLIFVWCSAVTAEQILPNTMTPEGWPVVERVTPVDGNTIHVAIIDTGAQITHRGVKEHLCPNYGEIGKDAHGNSKATNGIDDDGNGFIDDVFGWNFVDNNADLSDHHGHGHGTHIAGLINRYAGSADYCVMILRYYDPKSNESNNLINTVKAIQYATKMGAKVINYSGGGLAPSAEEQVAIEAFQDTGGIFVAAAGNERSDINVNKYYPASYNDGIIAVSAYDRGGHKLPSSNYSCVRKPAVDEPPLKELCHWEDQNAKKIEYEFGNNVYSTLPNDQYGYMTGTSQATAIMTGNLVNRMSIAKADKYFQILYDRKPAAHRRRSYLRSPKRLHSKTGRVPASAAGDDAWSHAKDAAYIQFGFKAEVDGMTKELEQRYEKFVPKELETYGVYPAAIIKVFMDRKLTLKWTW